MRTSRLSAVLAVSTVLTLGVSLPAAALTHTETRAPGSTADTSIDIVSTSLNYTGTQAVVTVTTAGPQTAFTDASWASEDRGVDLAFTINNYDFDPIVSISDATAQVTWDDEALCDVPVSITGNTLTATIESQCLGNPHKLKVDAEYFAGTESSALGTTVTQPGGTFLVGGDGGIFTYGDAKFHGSTGGMKLNSPVRDIASNPDGEGYWLVAGDGGIFSFGPDTFFHGSMGGKPLNAPVLTMAPTPSGDGYWLVAADGGVFTFGDAAFYGSTGDMRLNAPVVAMKSTPSGEGYWLFAADGGVFTFGDAAFHGSTGNMKLNSPIVGMANDGATGYTLLASDGGIFNFGSAEYYGSGAEDEMTADGLRAVAIIGATNGYSIVTQTGMVMNYGEAFDYTFANQYINQSGKYYLGPMYNAPFVAGTAS